MLVVKWRANLRQSCLARKRSSVFKEKNTSLPVKFTSHGYLKTRDQNIKKRLVYFWKEANKVERSGAHSRWSKGQSPSRQESITRILWYWVKLDLNCVLVLCFLIVWFFHIQQEDMNVLSVLLPKAGYQYRASYDLPQTCLPEKAFSHAKGFCFLPVLKMEICKQRLDTTQQWYMWAGFFFLWI